MNTRWKCPNCNSGLLAPTKPRMNDVRRYCLPCSAKTGKLVQRISPALEKKKAEKKVAATKRTSSKRETVSKKKEVQKNRTKQIKRVQTFGREGFHIEREAKKIWKLLEPYHNGKSFPKIQMQERGLTVEGETVWRSTGGVAGLAYIGENKIWLKVFPDWETLAHELCHLAVGVRKGLQNRRAHDKVFYDCLRDVAQRRFKVTISFYEVTKYGYAVDRIIERQLIQKNCYEIFKKKEK